jgi:hypothetical protein
MLRNSVPSWQTVWAEDGSIFYQQAQSNSAWESLFLPYNGSYLLLSRLLFVPTKWIPLGYLSYYITIICIAMYAIILVVIIISLRKIVTTTTLVNICVLFALTPMAGAESLQNISNLPWFWVISWSLYTIFGEPRMIGRIVYYIITIFLSASLPLMPIFVFLSLILPASINYWKKTRNLLSILYLFIISIIGYFQLDLAINTRVHGTQNLNLLISLIDAIYRILVIPVLGVLTFDLNNGVSTNKDILKLLLTYSYITIFLGIMYLVIKNGIYKIGIVTKTAQFSIFLILVTIIGVYIQISDFSNYYFSFVLANGRYFVTTGFAYIFFLIVLVFEIKPIIQNKNLSKLLYAMATIVTMSYIVNFSNNPSRYAPNFPQEIAELRENCLSNNSKEVVVYVSPANNEWKIITNCNKILE